MNRSPDLDLVLRDYFADDGLTAPDRVLNAVEQRIAVQRQRRAWPFPGRTTVNTQIKLIAGLAAALVVVVVGYNLLPRQTGVGGSTPSPVATSAASPTSTPSETKVPDPLAGNWISAPSTCDDQNAALQRAGYTAEQLTLGGWDAATCMDSLFGSFGSVHRVEFQVGVAAPAPSGTSINGRLAEYEDGVIGWDGYYVVVDASTFVAGDGGRATYLTYRFTIVGDQLTIDMVSDTSSDLSEAELWSDIIAQTVIYESLPFTRQP